MLNKERGVKGKQHRMPYTGLSWGKRAAPARLAATIASLVGLVALTGWAFRLPGLTSVLPGSVEMKANTAIALILCGLALLILVDRVSAGLDRLGQGLALAACAIGAWRLSPNTCLPGSSGLTS